MKQMKFLLVALMTVLTGMSVTSVSYTHLTLPTIA